MKEIDGWVKIKKYTDDEGWDICGDCIIGSRNCKYSYVSRTSLSDAGCAGYFIPGPSCPVWHGEGRSEWQPIETAPKDGTEILLLIPLNWVEQKQDDDRVGSGAFIQAMWFSQGKKDGLWLNRVDNWVKADTPTHWMPIPAQPQEK